MRLPAPPRHECHGRKSEQSHSTDQSERPWGRVGTEELPPRYLATEGTWEDLGRAINHLARRQRQVVCLADGAKAIWKVLERWFPDALGLLDWYHLQEHLAGVAKLLPAGHAWHAQ